MADLQSKILRHVVMFQFKPDFSIGPRLARFLYARPADPDNIMAGLAKAGLPDPS